MPVALLAGLSLILSLAASGVAVWCLQRTNAARSATPGEILLRMTELEQEWASTLESNARFMKRLAKRESDAAKRAQDAPEPTIEANGDGKSHLRTLARQRGILR
jgi:hypothetical protein